MAHDVLRLTLDGDTQLVCFVRATHSDAIQECTRVLMNVYSMLEAHVLLANMRGDRELEVDECQPDFQA